MRFSMLMLISIFAIGCNSEERLRLEKQSAARSKFYQDFSSMYNPLNKDSVLTIFDNMYKTNPDSALKFADSVVIIVNNEVAKVIELRKIEEQKELEAKNKAEAYEENRWQKSKAGRLQKKHPEWTREECELLAKNKIWIGMSYGMLVYLRGNPNHVNTSNYGNGNEYQACWDDYDPGCFYFGEDQIITSYN